MLINEKKMRLYAGDKIFNRGIRYFHEDRVVLKKLTNTLIEANVRGSGRTYSVTWFYVPDQDGWMAHCNCPYDYGSVCKHIVAVGLEANHVYGSEHDTSKPRETRPKSCLLYTSPSPRDRTRSRMPSSA